MSVLTIHQRRPLMTAVPAPRTAELVRVGDPAQDGFRLRSALAGPRQHLMPELHVLTGRLAPEDARRTHRQRADCVVMLVSRHSAAVETVVYPPLARVTGGKPLVEEDRMVNRTLALQLRRLRGAIEGDAFAGGVSPVVVARRIDGLLDHQESLRMHWAGIFAAEWGYDEQANLVERLKRAELRSPTRPHPYSPHSGLSGRTMQRIWAPIDRAMDAMDNRTSPAAAAPVLSLTA